VHHWFRSRAVAIVAVSLIAVIGGALLAWWQWTRYTSATGTLQNLGYVLQWPLFGLFPAFMFWRLRKLRTGQSAESRQAPPALEPIAPPPVRPAPTEDEDPELAAYNRYLAELNAQETKR